ncbi:hypothetical protein ACSBR1_018856 [Camellia fascicularis]
MEIEQKSKLNDRARKKLRREMKETILIRPAYPRLPISLSLCSQLEQNEKTHPLHRQLLFLTLCVTHPLRYRRSSSSSSSSSVTLLFSNPSISIYNSQTLRFHAPLQQPLDFNLQLAKGFYRNDMEEVIKFFETQHKGFYRNHMDEVIKFCEAQHKFESGIVVIVP